MLLWRLAGVFATLCLPAFLITANLRLVVNSPALYEYGFKRYNVPAITGLPMDQLLSVARQTREYFNSPGEEPLQAIVERNGYTAQLYNEREVQHMADVKQLFLRARRIEEWTGGIILGFAGLGLWLLKRRFPPLLFESTFQGSVITIVLLLLAGVGVLIDFEALFLQFHFMSFSNDLWQLNPNRDYLIMMYPEGFFEDATLAIAGLTLAEAALIAAGSWLLLGKVGSMAKGRRRPAPQPGTLQDER